jgi:hypothetical protein
MSGGTWHDPDDPAPDTEWMRGLDDGGEMGDPEAAYCDEYLADAVACKEPLSLDELLAAAPDLRSRTAVAEAVLALGGRAGVRCWLDPDDGSWLLMRGDPVRGGPPPKIGQFARKD